MVLWYFRVYIGFMNAKLLQSCPTLCDTMGCSLPGSSVLGIIRARILEWVAMLSSRGSSQSRNWTLYWFYLFPESFAVVLLVRGQVWYLNFQKIYPTSQEDYGTLFLFTQRSFHWHLFLRKRIDVNETVLNLPHWKEINNQTQKWFLSISSTLGNKITPLSAGLFTLLEWPNCTHTMSSTHIYRWSSRFSH